MSRQNPEARKQPNSRSAKYFTTLLAALVLSNAAALAREQKEESIPNKVTYNNSACTKINHGDYQGALEDLDKALSIDPLYATALENRSLARAGSGDIFGATNDIYVNNQTNSRIANVPITYKEYLSNFVDDYLEAFRQAQSIQTSLNNRKIPLLQKTN